ncbi:MAG: hypothetical protein ETSY2_28055 [Candidatus Entotheonella gemina]|uniref:Antitoxin n=1 Tax=Candidatus Entotheonella gemina TaxID=1429439 RepID=W4M4K7_9BACT|nr:MAG: hypothetical protein ETSY2_28055 [Candidatus Entotheonella gemina]
MKAIWALQDAKNRFREVVEQAIHHDPQFVTRRGKEAMVVLSVQDFQQLSAGQDSLVTFFRQSPFVGEDIDLTRDTDRGREIGL